MNYFKENSFTLKKNCENCFNEFEYCERDFYYIGCDNCYKFLVTCKFDLCQEEISIFIKEIPKITILRLGTIDKCRMIQPKCKECKEVGKTTPYITGREYASCISVTTRDNSFCWQAPRKKYDYSYLCYVCKKQINARDIPYYTPWVIQEEVLRNQNIQTE